MGEVSMKFNFDQWAAENPVPEISSEPEFHYGKFASRKDAESWKDSYHQHDDSFATSVVQFRGRYYLIDLNCSD